MQLIIVGASDAGIAAGLRAREVDPWLEVTIFAADAYPNFSICGLPYWLSKEVADWRSLAHRTREDLVATGLELRLDEPVAALDAAQRQITLAQGNAPAMTDWS